jgi:hypothetical protein
MISVVTQLLSQLLVSKITVLKVKREERERERKQQTKQNNFCQQKE